MRRWLLPVAGAVAVAALGIVINFATDLRTNWWAWVTVVALTIVVGVVTAVTGQAGAQGEAGVSNVITGQVSGNVVQASEINGPVTLLGSRPDLAPDEFRST